MDNRGWFADVDNSGEQVDSRWPWQPCIQTDSGCFDIDVWFETEEDCLNFIRSEILGKDILDD